MASPNNNPSPADAAGSVKIMTGSVLRLVAILAVVIATLTALDRFLAKTESAELQSSARNSYRIGSRLLQEGRASKAADALRTAHALARENLDYELTLIAAFDGRRKYGGSGSADGRRAAARTG